jgi:hypothetical protein
MATILVVDDDADTCRNLADILDHGTTRRDAHPDESEGES